MGRHFTVACMAIGGFMAITSVVHAQSAWNTTVNTDFRYYAWSNTLGGNGSQVYARLGVQLSGRPSPDWKLDFLVRTGYIWSRQSTATASSRVETPTDTNFTPSAAYLGLNDAERSDAAMRVVSHEMGFARRVADRVVFMDAGKNVEDAASEDFFSTPRTPRVAEFLSKILTH